MKTTEKENTAEIDATRLYEIVHECAEPLRKGEKVEVTRSSKFDKIEVFDYKPTNEASATKDFEKVDMVFFDVLVNKKKAELRKEEIASILENYPDQSRLAGGPSYIEFSPSCGLEQQEGLMLMAIGKTLGLWGIVTPGTLHIEGQEALRLAGNGMVMIEGYKSIRRRA